MGILLCDEAREAREGILPEGIDQRAQFGQARRVETKEVLGTLALFLHQARRFQYLQMLGDGRAAYGKLVGQLAHGQGAPAQQVQHGLARGIGKSREHRLTVTHDLR